MNAYELAEILEKNQFLNPNATKEATNMLRQQEYRNIAQSDRIAILEAQNKQQANRIAELERKVKYLQMANEFLKTKTKNRGFVGTKHYGEF